MKAFHTFLDQIYFSNVLSDKEKNSRLLQGFLNQDINEYKQQINKQSSSFWLKEGEKRALKLFKHTAEHVPAYKDFLDKNSVDPQKINTFSDFSSFVPLIDKKNYISQYSLSEMCVDGNLNAHNFVSFSSGTSSNEPYFWPRGTYQDVEGAFFHELMLTSLFDIQHKKTLVVICFAMGNYVAGTYTLTSCELVTLKDYPMTIVSPGINQIDTLKMIKKMAPEYEQVILVGYPPLLKDLLHAENNLGIDWGKIPLKFLFASELFSESWRDQIFSQTRNEFHLNKSTNIYGAADATLFGYEMPINILSRKLILSNPEMQFNLFQSALTPTFVQFNPMMRFFELVGDELILSASAGIPLIRYNLHDKGGVISHEELQQQANTFGYDLPSLLKDDGCEDSLFNLPHVYVLGRTDGALSLYGLLIHQDYIRAGLERPEIQDKVTGKFNIEIVQNSRLAPQLVVHVELTTDDDENKELNDLISKNIIMGLKIKSTEYNRLLEAMKKKAHPKIYLYAKGKSELFKIAIKQKWMKNNNDKA